MRLRIPHYTAQVLKVLQAQLDLDVLSAGAEVGVASGSTSMALLKVFPRLTLYMVDKYKLGELRQDLNECMLLAKQKTEFARERRVMLVTHSVEAARMVPDELDFVFVDANHYYPYVMRDLQAWAPKLRKGGILIGHDYNAPHEYRQNRWGVKAAVDDFVAEKEWELNIESHLIWWCHAE